MSCPSPCGKKGGGVGVLDVTPPVTDLVCKLLCQQGVFSARFVTHMGCGRAGPRTVPGEVTRKVHSVEGNSSV